MRGATIAEVAAEAGVGIGTVSRVLNGSPAVSDRTRRRVLDAIATLDYQPSAAARALSTGRTGAIGVIYYDTVNDAGRKKTDIWYQSSFNDGVSWNAPLTHVPLKSGAQGLPSHQ